MQCGLKRSKLTVQVSFPAKTQRVFRLKLPSTREQMNFASLTPGQLHKESNAMTLCVNLFDSFKLSEQFDSTHGPAVTQL